MRDIAGKTAFVTGAASGIGLGIATALSQAGVKVMLCDIEDAALVKAVADLKLTNADVDGVRADVSLKAERAAVCHQRWHVRLQAAQRTNLFLSIFTATAARYVGGRSVFVILLTMAAVL